MEERGRQVEGERGRQHVGERGRQQVEERGRPPVSPPRMIHLDYHRLGSQRDKPFATWCLEASNKSLY